MLIFVRLFFHTCGPHMGERKSGVETEHRKDDRRTKKKKYPHKLLWMPFCQSKPTPFTPILCLLNIYIIYLAFFSDDNIENRNNDSVILLFVRCRFQLSLYWWVFDSVRNRSCITRSILLSKNLNEGTERKKTQKKMRSVRKKTCKNREISSHFSNDSANTHAAHILTVINEIQIARSD